MEPQDQEPTGSAPLHTMSAEAQLTVIAEACGELEPHITKPTIAELEAMLNDPTPRKMMLLPNGEVRAVRDYLSDLNAAFAFLEKLSKRFDIAISRHNGSWWHVEITEPSREYIASNKDLAFAACEAGLKAIGKWEET